MLVQIGIMFVIFLKIIINSEGLALNTVWVLAMFQFSLNCEVDAINSWISARPFLLFGLPWNKMVWINWKDYNFSNFLIDYTLKFLVMLLHWHSSNDIKLYVASKGKFIWNRTDSVLGWLPSLHWMMTPLCSPWSIRTWLDHSNFRKKCPSVWRKSRCTPSWHKVHVELSLTGVGAKYRVIGHNFVGAFAYVEKSLDSNVVILLQLLHFHKCARNMDSFEKKLVKAVRKLWHSLHDKQQMQGRSGDPDGKTPILSCISQWEWFPNSQELCVSHGLYLMCAKTNVSQLRDRQPTVRLWLYETMFTGNYQTVFYFASP